MGKIGGEPLEEGRSLGLCAAGQSRRSCGEGAQKPSRPAGAAPHKSALHACKSPHRCYFIYCGLRDNCFLFAKIFSLTGFSPPLQPWSLVPRGHIEKSVVLTAPPPSPSSSRKRKDPAWAGGHGRMRSMSARVLLFLPGRQDWRAVCSK